LIDSYLDLFFEMAAGSIENEGPDMGVGDFVLLSEISMNAFVKNLKLRLDFCLLIIHRVQ